MTISIVDKDEQDGRYDRFDVYFYSYRIQTMVTADPDMATQWISDIEALHGRRLHRLIVGLDVEWRPSFNSNCQNPVATLQLCVDRRCLIFQLLYCRYIPDSLVSFLGKQEYTFVGVGIQNDANKLRDDYELSVRNVVDLRGLAADGYDTRKMMSAGLKELCRVILGREIEKPKHLSMGCWDDKWLNAHQVQYACLDAFVSFEIGRRLNAAASRNTMSTGELLNVKPLELKFPFELKKQISCSIHLSNKTENLVAFKVKTTNPRMYCVRPNTGVVLPRSTCDVIVTMQAQKEAPSDMQCKDKFLLQCVAADPSTTPKDIAQEMFNKETGRVVEECKLRVVYLPPPQPPSPVAEGSEEGSSPSQSMIENGNQNGSEAKSAISRLMAEKAATLQQSNRLRQELELLKRDMSRSRSGGVSFLFVVMVGLLGFALGYVVKRT